MELKKYLRTIEREVIKNKREMYSIEIEKDFESKRSKFISYTLKDYFHTIISFVAKST